MMSHKSDVLDFVLCLGALFFFSSWLKLNLRQGRRECGLIEITEGSLHCFLPLSHLLWPLSPPSFLPLFTHMGNPEGYVWLAGGFVTEGHSEPPSSLSSPRLHLQASSRLAPIFPPWIFTPTPLRVPTTAPLAKLSCFLSHLDSTGSQDADCPPQNSFLFMHAC